MLLSLVLAASSVTLFTGEELAQKNRPTLKTHLLELDAELYVLEQSLALTGGDMFLKASGEAAPFVAFAGAPALLLGFLIRPSSGTSGSGPLIQTGAIVAAALLGSAVLGAIVYGVVRVIMHGFARDEWAGRQRQLNDYRPSVVKALTTAPPAAPTELNQAPPRS